MTPMEARINASLRLASVAMVLRSWKIEGTNGWSAWAVGSHVSIGRFQQQRITYSFRWTSWHQ